MFSSGQMNFSANFKSSDLCQHYEQCFKCSVVFVRALLLDWQALKMKVLLG